MIHLITTPSNSIFGILQISRILEYTDELVWGLLTTMGLYLFAIIIGLGLGLVISIIRHFGGPLTSRIATAYIEIFRGTPLLAQILAVVAIPPALNAWLISQGSAPFDLRWAITVIGPFGNIRVFLDTTILLCAIILAVNSAAYQAEFFRGSMASISAGQSLAAESMGMTKNQMIRHVILPQSLRRAIPAWSNEAVYLPKYTTLAYVVSVEELFAKAKLVVARTYQALAVYVMVAIIFLIMISLISWLFEYVYRRVKIPGI